MITISQLHRFNQKVENNYREYRLARDIISLRITAAAAVVHTASTIYGDYLVVSKLADLISIRIVVVIILLSLVWVSYTKAISARNFHYFAMFGIGFYASSCFFLDYQEVMPEFFLSFSLILTAFVNSIGIGLLFTKSLLLNGAMMMAYFVYCRVTPDHGGTTSELIYISTIFAVASFFAYLFERESRVNFSNHIKLSAVNRELDKANHTKIKILSLLSHDLNGPLANLEGILNLKQLNCLSENEFEHFLEKTRLNLKATMDLLSNLTKWSLTQMDGFKPNLAPVNLLQLTKGVIESLGTLPNKKSVIFKLSFDQRCICLADEDILKIAVRNILVNSIKFSHPDSFVRILGTSNDQRTRLAITDHGVGMNEEEVAKLFSFRMKSRRGTENESGSGLGLVLTKEFLALSGAAINVDSSPGIGTTFTLDLPTTKCTEVRETIL